MRTLIIVADSLKPYTPPEAIVESCTRHPLLEPFDPIAWRRRSRRDRDGDPMPVEGSYVLCGRSQALHMMSAWAAEIIETHVLVPPPEEFLAKAFTLAEQTGFRFMLITRDAVYTFGFDVEPAFIMSEDILTMVDGVLGPGSVRIGGRDAG